MTREEQLLGAAMQALRFINSHGHNGTNILKGYGMETEKSLIAAFGRYNADELADRIVALQLEDQEIAERESIDDVEPLQ